MSLIKGVQLDKAKSVHDLSFTHDGKVINKYGFSILDRVWWVWMEHLQQDELREASYKVVCSEIIRRWNLVEEQESAQTPREIALRSQAAENTEKN